jgi:hypothetical protein
VGSCDGAVDIRLDQDGHNAFRFTFTTDIGKIDGCVVIGLECLTCASRMREPRPLSS